MMESVKIVLLTVIILSTFNGCTKTEKVYVETPRPHLQTYYVKAPKNVKYQVYTEAE